MGKYAKPACLVINEELRLFVETPELILTVIKTIDIGLRQRRMKSEKGMHIIAKDRIPF